MDKNTVVFGIIDDIPGKKGKILLLHEKGKPKPVLWKFPGGTCEGEELMEKTLVREILEETELAVVPCGKSFFEKIKDGNYGKHRIIVFRCQYESGEIMEGKEIEKIKLVSPEEAMIMIKERQIVPTHIEPLKKFLELYYGLETD